MEETSRLKNGGDNAISPDETFAVIEKFSHALSVLTFLLVVDIIDDEQYMIAFFETKLFKE